MYVWRGSGSYVSWHHMAPGYTAWLMLETLRLIAFCWRAPVPWPTMSPARGRGPRRARGPLIAVSEAATQTDAGAEASEPGTASRAALHEADPNPDPSVAAPAASDPVGEAMLEAFVDLGPASSDSATHRADGALGPNPDPTLRARMEDSAVQTVSQHALAAAGPGGWGGSANPSAGTSVSGDAAAAAGAAAAAAGGLLAPGGAASETAMVERLQHVRPRCSIHEFWAGVVVMMNLCFSGNALSA